MDKAKPMFGDPIGDWKWWFAWFPVELFDGGYIWFKTVQRRRIQLHSYLNAHTDWFWWQYREIKKP